MNRAAGAMARVDRSVSFLQGQLWGSVLGLAVGAAFYGAFYLTWGSGGIPVLRSLTDTGTLKPVGALMAVVAGMIGHELLHGLGWVLAGKKDWTLVSYGFSLKAFAPYAHLKEPIGVPAYRIGALLPGIVLGGLPWLLGMMLGSELLALYGVLFTVAAGGDLLVLGLLRGVPPGWKVQDHPDRIGCLLYGDEVEEDE